MSSGTAPLFCGDSLALRVVSSLPSGQPGDYGSEGSSWRWGGAGGGELSLRTSAFIIITVISILTCIPSCEFSECYVTARLDNKAFRDCSPSGVFVTGGGLVSRLCPTLEILWAVVFMGFSRQEYWSWLPFPLPGHLLHPGTDPGSPALQADS